MIDFCLAKLNAGELPDKTERCFWVKFRLFSAHIPKIFRLWYPIHHFSAHMFTDLAYFRLFSSYFQPKMVLHPFYKLKHGTHLPFFHPHVYRFRLFSAYVPLIFRRSCLAGCRDDRRASTIEVMCCRRLMNYLGLSIL